MIILINGSDYFVATNPKVGVRMDENQLQILDDLPSSAVEMQVKDKVCRLYRDAPLYFEMCVFFNVKFVFVPYSSSRS